MRMRSIAQRSGRIRCYPASCLGAGLPAKTGIYIVARLLVGAVPRSWRSEAIIYRAKCSASIVAVNSGGAASIMAADSGGAARSGWRCIAPECQFEMSVVPPGGLKFCPECGQKQNKKCGANNASTTSAVSGVGQGSAAAALVGRAKQSSTPHEPAHKPPPESPTRDSKTTLRGGQASPLLSRGSAQETSTDTAQLAPKPATGHSASIDPSLQGSTQGGSGDAQPPSPHQPSSKSESSPTHFPDCTSENGKVPSAHPTQESGETANFEGQLVTTFINEESVPNLNNQQVFEELTTNENRKSPSTSKRQNQKQHTQQQNQNETMQVEEWKMKETEEQKKKEAEEQKKEAEEQKKKEAEEQKKNEAEEQKKEAEEQKKKEEEERKKESEEQKKNEAEEQKKEAEEQKKKEEEEQKKKEAEEQKKKKAEEQKKEAEEQKKKEAEEQKKNEAEEQKKEAEEQKKKEEEERKKESEEQKKKEAEEQKKKEAEEQKKKGAEEWEKQNKPDKDGKRSTSQTPCTNGDPLGAAHSHTDDNASSTRSRPNSDVDQTNEVLFE